MLWDEDERISGWAALTDDSLFTADSTLWPAAATAAADDDDDDVTVEGRLTAEFWGNSLASDLVGFWDWLVTSRAMGSLPCTGDTPVLLGSSTASPRETDDEDDGDGLITLDWVWDNSYIQKPQYHI